MTPVTASFQPLEAAAEADVVLPRGAIIRIIDRRENEPELDVLIMEYRDAPSGFAIVVASGYKAGIKSLNFPLAARRDLGIQTSWLLANWTNWYSETKPDAVFVAADGYRLRT